MIIESEFLEEIKRFAHLKCLTIPIPAAKDVFPKFEEFTRVQLSSAIEEMENSDERFDFSKLLRRVRNRRADEIEDQAGQEKDEYGRISKKFWKYPLYSGECKQGQCKGCLYVKNCRLRGREWLKGIQAIMRGNLGKKGADQLLRFMTNEFMGGIN